MNNLIIIDDTTCKDELSEFVSLHADHIKILLTEEEYNIDLDLLIHRIQDIFTNQKILFVKTEESVIKTTTNDILYIQELNGNPDLHLKSGKVYRLPDRLSHYNNILSDYNIIQINNYTLINANLIESFIISDGILFCSDGSKFIVGEEYKTNLINQLNNIYT
jgi:DNA-binding LytR/AlgR family response regulator